MTRPAFDKSLTKKGASWKGFTVGELYWWCGKENTFDVTIRTGEQWVRLLEIDNIDGKYPFKVQTDIGVMWLAFADLHRYPKGQRNVDLT